MVRNASASLVLLALGIIGSSALGCGSETDDAERANEGTSPLAGNGRDPTEGAAPAATAALYVDGTNGSDKDDGSSPDRAKKTLGNLNVDGKTVFLKRGTRIALSTSLRTFDTKIEPYGSGAAPVVFVPEGAKAGISAKGGLFTMTGTELRGNAATKADIVGVGVTNATKAIVVDCVVDGFFNGLQVAGTDGTIARNVIRNLSNNAIVFGAGQYGDKNGGVPPSRYLVDANRIDASGTDNDAITLHNGWGKGWDNRITNNVIENPGENCVDVQPQYHRTIIEGNVCVGSKEYGIVIASKNDADGGDLTQVIGNEFRNSKWAAVNSRAANATIADNYVHDIASEHGATAFLVYSTATIRNNRVEMPASTERPAIRLAYDETLLVPGPSIVAEGNVFVNASKQPIYLVDDSPGATDDAILGRSKIDRNTYRLADPNVTYFDGRTFGAWTATKFPGANPYKDGASTLQRL